MRKCRSCSSSDLALILDLGDQPWCNNFLKEEDVGKEKTYPLRLVYCYRCSLLQLDYTIPKEVMFTNHPYVSGTSPMLRNHFLDTARVAANISRAQEYDTILDIGGNDGTALLQYKSLGFKDLVNVESAGNIAKLSSEAGINTLNRFFNLEMAKEKFVEKSTKIVNASGVFFHLEELHGVTEAIKYILAMDGVFVCQFMYAGDMIDKGQYDTIYHEHLCYYTLKSFKNLIEPYGLKVFNAYHTPVHGGSLVVHVGHTDGGWVETSSLREVENKDSKYDLESVIRFSMGVSENRGRLLPLVEKYKTVHGYGAPAKGNTLLNYCGITTRQVKKLVEKNPLKFGRYAPGSHIPVTEETPNDRPDIYLLLCHNLIDEVVENNRGVPFIVPFPFPHVYKKL